MICLYTRDPWPENSKRDPGTRVAAEKVIDIAGLPLQRKHPVRTILKVLGLPRLGQDSHTPSEVSLDSSPEKNTIAAPVTGLTEENPTPSAGEDAQEGNDDPVTTGGKEGPLQNEAGGANSASH
jgi:hypothetical protein